MPIFNKKSLMPVESNYERTVLKIILSTCKSLKDIKIEKPLFDIIEKEFHFRPDFIIHYKDEKKIFIEVLGSQNNEYLNHKNAIALKARQYCHEYISIRAFNLNQEYEPFVHKLKKAMTIHFTSDNYVL
jgi:predicted nuclease of restriction endonuclease-like RecB superfamily